MNMKISNNTHFLAEWEEQDAILISLPNESTDWNYILDEVKECYLNIAKAILKNMS